MGRYVSPQKLHLSVGGSGSPSIAWYLWSARVINSNGISIGSAVFVRVQMLCCTKHYQCGRNPQNCSFPLEFRHMPEDRTTAICNMHKKLVKIARVVREICSRTDRDRHTHRRADYNTSPPLPRANTHP